MSEGAIPLKNYPYDKIVVACRKCRLAAQYDKSAMIESVGPDIGLPTLLIEIAAKWQCPLAMKQASNTHIPGFERCGAVFPDLGMASRAEPSA